MLRYANPARFLRLANAVLPWSAGATVVAFATGLYLALLDSPPDYQQGETVRIMYLHVPAAWMALFVYVTMAAAAVVSVVWRHPLADVYIKAVAPVGACFTALCLVTGSLWGEPMWGTWWVWDARLTSVLVLFFVYLGIVALEGAFDDPERGMKAAAILVLVGSVNLPIVKFSVDWWATLHQPASIIRLGGPTVDTLMLVPLFAMVGAFKLYFLTVALIRMRTALTERKVEVLRLGLR